ncbi:MAG: Undecaprenyl-phosphate galactose phosphotransferase [Candidatus Saccharibacteria bacterium]|nr:Undecaprenyl-phosphate galactose phosphotransferase [Candidatus Saccharibacteria bacterium]
MKNNASILYNICLIIGDFLALVAAFVGAFVLRISLDDRPAPYFIPAVTYLKLFLLLLPFWILVFALLGLYNSSIYEKRFRELGRLAIGSFIGMMFAILWDFFSVRPIFPAHAVPLYGLGLAFVFLVIFRNIARFIRGLLFGFNRGLTHILLVGNNKMTAELVDWLIDSKRSGYKVVGVVGGKTGLGKHGNVKLYHSFKDFDDRHRSQLHLIVQTELYADDQKNLDILNFAQTNHIGYRFVPGNTELFVGNLDVELFRSSIPMIAVHQTALLGWGRVVKRIFDFGVSSVLIVLASPIMLLVAVLEMLSGSGSVFFRQTRLTRYNNEFQVFKFRSQYKRYDGTTPEEAFRLMGKPELAIEYRKNGDYLAKDPRVTALGRFLRRSSLDELPQLFNVWRGELSLVGPRALIPQELAVYEKRHAILAVKSGITGLAQVSGRRNISFDERRKLDVYYVQNWSFWMDVMILLKTVRSVLGSEGAK